MFQWIMLDWKINLRATTNQLSWELRKVILFVLTYCQRPTSSFRSNLQTWKLWLIKLQKSVVIWLKKWALVSIHAQRHTHFLLWWEEEWKPGQWTNFWINYGIQHLNSRISIWAKEQLKPLLQFLQCCQSIWLQFKSWLMNSLRNPNK